MRGIDELNRDKYDQSYLRERKSYVSKGEGVRGQEAG